MAKKTKKKIKEKTSAMDLPGDAILPEDVEDVENTEDVEPKAPETLEAEVTDESDVKSDESPKPAARPVRPVLPCWDQRRKPVVKGGKSVVPRRVKSPTGKNVSWDVK